MSLSCASSGYVVEVFRRIIEGTNKTASDGELLLLLHRSECKPITRPAVISFGFVAFAAGAASPIFFFLFFDSLSFPTLI